LAKKKSYKAKTLEGLLTEKSIIELIWESGVMLKYVNLRKYNHFKENGTNPHGGYMDWEEAIPIIYIGRSKDRHLEDISIIHEMVHLAECYYFDEHIFSEEDVEEYAQKIYREKSYFAEMIRSLFKDVGF